MVHPRNDPKWLEPECTRSPDRERTGEPGRDFCHQLLCNPSRTTVRFALEVVKDPYIFDFLGRSAEISERDLHRSLLERLRDFLVELGIGFAFLGSEYHLEIGDQDFYLDPLPWRSGEKILRRIYLIERIIKHEPVNICKVPDVTGHEYRSSEEADAAITASGSVMDAAFLISIVFSAMVSVREMHRAQSSRCRALIKPSGE